jgi:predicted O-methyltransferase YrrM
MTKVLIPKELDKYAEMYSSPESKVLAALNRETNMKVDKAVMLSGHIQGAFLQMISHMTRPKNVLEIGTYTGYSAICLAHGLQNDGHLHTIDINEELEDMCFRYFCEAGLEGKITQHIGKAADIIPTLNETFELVFIDADKPNYGKYYDLVFDKVAVGGIILADNVLFEGEVVLPEEQQSKNARAMHAFNDKVRKDQRVEQVLLPLRDGIMMMRKIAS